MENQNRDKSQATTAKELLRFLLAQDKRTTKSTFSIPWASKVFEGVFEHEVKLFNRQYVCSEEQKSSFKKVCEWIENPNSTCGMILAGPPGNGKTTVIHAIRTIINNCGKSDPIAKDYNNQPVKAYLKIAKAYEINEMFLSEPEAFKRLKKVGLLAIDDFGTETLEVQAFGNVYSPIVDLLYTRYDNRQFTIISTNLLAKNIRERYGDRIADRFNEMMTTVSFPFISFRT